MLTYNHYMKTFLWISRLTIMCSYCVVFFFASFIHDSYANQKKTYSLSPTHSKLNPSYRLGMVIVIDQLRADYLTKYKDEFLPESEKGIKFLMNQGAYFPLADHGLLQNMTGPGHAAILSGAYPYRHGIPINYWFNTDTKEDQYCVDDKDAKIVGSDGILDSSFKGVSPKLFNATTVGDELKNSSKESRVVSFSLKDRAAVLLGGKRSDVTAWFNDKKCEWVSSQFYVKEGQLPAFIKEENKNFKKEEIFSFGPYKNIKSCSPESLRTPWAVEKTFQLALAAVKEMKLGKGEFTDLLLISLSSHDYLGHQFGPNHEALKEMILEEDKKISQFLKKMDKEIKGGLSSSFIVLTGDHGTPHSPASLPKDKIPNENIPIEKFEAIVEKTLNDSFGKIRQNKDKNAKWISSINEFNVYFNKDNLADKKITLSQVVSVLKPVLMKEYYIDQVLFRDEILVERKLPQGEYAQFAERTLTKNSGDIIVIFKPFFYSDRYPLTHMTHYSYDRYVPLVLFGKSFNQGIYREIVRVIDIAPTLSSILGIIPPSQSEGRVMSEIIKN